MSIISDHQVASSSNPSEQSIGELARPEPIRVADFVDPALLSSLPNLAQYGIIPPQLPSQMAFYPQQQWLYPPLIHFDFNSFHNNLPVQQNPPAHEEKDRDSGNETSSLSPGTRTPLTNSPSSIPSR
jgi:hypothetical protein